VRPQFGAEQGLELFGPGGVFFASYAPPVVIAHGTVESRHQLLISGIIVNVFPENRFQRKPGLQLRILVPLTQAHSERWIDVLRQLDLTDLRRPVPRSSGGSRG
jgi:hypothetical protein